MFECKFWISSDFILFFHKLDFSYIFSAGGPSCTVTSMLPGSMFSSSMEGTCYPVVACKGLKGIAIGSCGNGNVCCACKLNTFNIITYWLKWSKNFEN